MTGALPMGNNKITGMADPAISTDGATKNYVDTATAAVTVPVPAPQGYLTPSTGVKVITSDVVSATTIYYTPDIGLWNPIHNGTAIVPYKLAGELSLTITTSQAASNIYDIFLAYNGGAPVIGTGPSWAAGTGGSTAAGSCARGTGTGGTALQRIGGIYTNAAAISLIWNTGGGNTTLSVPINQGVYLGSILIDGVAGQVTCHRSYGQLRKFGIWNAYNRVPILLKGGDPTANWSYSSGTYRESNGSSSNVVTVFQGLAEESLDLAFSQYIVTNGINRTATIGVGWNSTTTISGVTPIFGNSGGSNQGVQTASFLQAPSLGQNNVVCIEAAPAALAVTFYGGEGQMVLSAKYRG